MSWSTTYIIILHILQGEKNEYNRKKPKHSTLPIFLIAPIQMKHNIMKKGLKKRERKYKTEAEEKQDAIVQLVQPQEIIFRILIELGKNNFLKYCPWGAVMR